MRFLRLKLPTWAWLTLIAAVPRFLRLGAEAFWYDEAFTAYVSRLDLPNMLGAVQGDVHPPLFYLLQWLNVRLLGADEFALRLPSAILGVLAVLLVWRIALELGLSRWAALTAAFMAAFLPAALYYSQEARMYTMLACFVLGMLWAALRGNWIAFALCAILTFNTQNLGIFYVLSIGGAAFLWHRTRRVLVMGVVVALAYLPNAALVLEQARDVANGFWIQPLSVGGFFEPFLSMTMGWRVGEALRMHVYGAAAGATIIGLLVWRNRRQWLLYAAIFGAPLLVAVVSVLWRPIYLPRAFLPSTLMLCILWAGMLPSLGGMARRVAYGIPVPALVIGAVAHYFPAMQRDDPREWLQPAFAAWQEGDVIYYTAIHSAILQQHYADGRPYRLRPGVSDLNQTLTEETKAYMGFQEAYLWDLAGQGFNRAWVSAYINPMSRADEIAFVETLRYAPPARLIAERGNEFAYTVMFLVQLRW